MTDTRLHQTFLSSPKIDALEDVEFRTYVNGLVYAGSQETDGLISRRSLRLLHPTADVLVCASALVSAGLWEPLTDGWLIHDFLDYQTSKAQAAAARTAARKRKAKSRAGSQSQRDEPEGHGVTNGPVTESNEGRSQRDESSSHGVTSGLVTESDKGQDRTGKDRVNDNATPTEPDPWGFADSVSICEAPHCSASLGPALTEAGKSMHDTCRREFEQLEHSG